MGLCVSSRITRQGGIQVNLPTAAQVIHWNGRLQELWQPTIAAEILSHNPNFFLSSSETMHVNAVPGPVAKDEQLQPGQLYFLLPIPMLRLPLSLQDLCVLAVKASKALSDPDMGRATLQTSVILQDENSAAIGFFAATMEQGPVRSCQQSYDGAVGMVSRVTFYRNCKEQRSCFS
ncbi:uncharacterized protein LOC113758659 [Coffea eugenioides]|uniref:uncharacterized protein LOC113758659 n=1 Tax=Coffea eugenioides TaxID=49369 RepID=UPI000F60A5FE|nr:uncharacterized protein LOC113758659 [Coffea eugenioides]